MQWEGHQSFVKRNSSICTKYFNVKKAMQSLKTGLIELTRMRVVAANLTLQLSLYYLPCFWVGGGGK